MKTKTSTIYPELLSMNVANSTDIIYRDTTFMNVLGAPVSIQPIQQTGSKVNPSSLNNYLVQRLQASKLNGYVPSDGAKYGIDGTPQSWANLLTNLAGKESSFNNNTVGDVGRFVGNSNGLFQLSPNDALNYKLQSTPFTQSQLRDPYTNADAAVRIAESLVGRDGSIAGYGNGKNLGMSAYWGPLRRGWTPTDTYTYNPPTLAATTSSANNLQKQLDLSVQYWNAKKSNDPINNLTKFFNGLNSELQGLNNDFVFFWYKKLQAQPDDVKSQVEVDENSLLAEPSDSVGYLTNTLSQFSEYVSPVFDVNLDYGPPQTVPTSVQNKLPEGTLELSYDLSFSNSQMMKTNQVNVQKVNDTYNIATDSTQPHGLNLVTDIPSYQDSYKAQAPSLNCLVSKFGQDRFEYLNYFSNMNDNMAYNPANTSANNLQSMPNINYTMNVEGTPQQVDILKKKVINSMNYRTIKGALACKSRQKNGGVTTEESNRSLLYQSRTVRLATPISLSQKATAKLAAANYVLQYPNQQISDLISKVNQTGIGNLPFTETLLAPIYNLQGIAGGVTGGLTSSLGNIQSIAQSPLSNLPNVLPSVDPGSFPQIYSLLSNTSFSNLNAGSIVGTAQQLKGIICDFKLPIIGKINFNSLTNINITKDFQSALNSLVPKMPKIDDFKKALNGLVPDFKQLWSSFYTTFFECDNKDDYS